MFAMVAMRIFSFYDELTCHAHQSTGAAAEEAQKCVGVVPSGAVLTLG